MKLGRHVLGLAVVVGLVLGLAACEKPSEDNCRKALANMRTLLGTTGETKDVDADIRRCTGGSSKKAVECAVNAKTLEELDACGFHKKKK